MFRAEAKRSHAAVVMLVLLMVGGSVRGESGTSEFQEVYQIVLTNLPGISRTDLDRAAMQGILSNLFPKVSLIASESSSSSPAQTGQVAKATVIEGHIGYFQIAQVGEGLASSLQDDYRRLNATNKLEGVVLDLRYANGADYAPIIQVAGLFLKEEKPVLDWGSGMRSASPAGEPIKLPVAVLVNGETKGAPEALAGALRELGVAILLGSKTAGQAMVAKDFVLQNGEKLAVMSGAVVLGDGSKLPPSGVKPDIQVEVPPSEEKAFFENPFRESGTNAFDSTVGNLRPRYNEADLVREHREGFMSNRVQRARRPEEPLRLITDPALARATDLLKGLAVVRRAG